MNFHCGCEFFCLKVPCLAGQCSTTEPWRLGDVEQHWWFSPVLLVLDTFETTILTIRNICALSFYVTLNKRNLEVLCCVEENIFSFIRARAHTHNMMQAFVLGTTSASSSSSSEDASDDAEDNNNNDDDDENKKKKKKQPQNDSSHYISIWKTPHSSTKAFMRRAASVGDLLHVKNSSSSSSSEKKNFKKSEHLKDVRVHSFKTSSSKIQNAIIVILSSLLIFSLLVIKQQNKNKKILEIDYKLHNTISALATRAQWSEVEMKGSNRKMVFNNKRKNNNKKRIQIDAMDLLDEYGLPTLAAQCEREVEWPLLTSFVEEVAQGKELSICESFLDRLPKTLRVHTFPLSVRAQMRYNSLRKLPTFNRGYDVEDYLVRWLSNGPFSINRKKTLTEKTEIAYLLPIQPYLDRVSSFPFSDGRARSESGVKSAVQYAKKVNPSLWEQSKGRRVIVTVHDFGTELATKIYPDDDEDDDIYASSSSASSSSILSSSPSSSFSSSSSLVNTTHFIVSNSEIDVDNAPFDARKDVAVVPSLSFFLPREAVSRGLVDLSHFMRDEEEYASFGLRPPKFDVDRNIRLMFRGNSRGPLREKVFQYLVENGNEDDSIETTGIASPQEYMSLMEHSKYCLHVRGTRVMSPRLIELMLFGCVPVIVADAYELPLAWFLDWSKFSIRVPESDYKNIHAYIEQANWRELHANLGRVISFFVYHKSEPVVGDAFYATSLGLLNKLEHNNVFV